MSSQSLLYLNYLTIIFFKNRMFMKMNEPECVIDIGKSKVGTWFFI